ncbi:hypothetical protein EV580_2747 [Mycobacterium sp. BK086]|uniref:hypothetical protein n=1 Tax=Mycobacterium sp. BK086 TaxID=2512165 RepID=UPI001060D6CB|nr:hypothetical protein [Mycobacterium sp. BK086]TDO14614.1 hypothetical protein EV580_2747 [Mycobacterium sp. BK086]
MEPRSLKRLLNLPKNERNAVVAEGLRLLGDYVEELQADAQDMHDNGRSPAAAVLDVFTAEQAASFMILLDLVRAGWDADQLRVNEQIKRFQNHLARGLYVEAYSGLPATLRELREYLTFHRRSHYLDGPNDVDWIFRNDILEKREGPLYVDYIAYETGGKWETPLSRDHSYRMVPKIVDVVRSLHRAGISQEQALNHVADVWLHVDLADLDMHWQDVRKANIEVLTRTGVTEQTKLDAQQAVEGWIHPLNMLEMSFIEVTPSELEAERDHWLNAQW